MLLQHPPGQGTQHTEEKGQLLEKPSCRRNEKRFEEQDGSSDPTSAFQTHLCFSSSLHSCMKASEGGSHGRKGSSVFSLIA